MPTDRECVVARTARAQGLEPTVPCQGPPDRAITYRAGLHAPAPGQLTGYDIACSGHAYQEADRARRALAARVAVEELTVVEPEWREAHVIREDDTRQ